MGNEMFDLEEMQEIVEDFLVESDELVTKLDADLVTLEGRPEDLDLLNEIFRSAHTIKGTSGFLGFDDLTSLTHVMEDVLNKLRKGELAMNPSIMDVLLESVDLLRGLLAAIREKRDHGLDLEPVKERLQASLGGGAVSGSGQGDSPGESVDATPSAKDECDRTAGEADVSPTEPEEPTVLEEAAGVVPARDERAGTAAPESGGTPAARPTPAGRGAEQTVRVDIGRLDNLMNMVGELVLGRNALLQTSGRIARSGPSDNLTEDLTHAATQVNFITTELQMAVLKMRMFPVGKVFNRFPRMVRDLTRDSGKSIELRISGEETELDKSVIEEISDPLVHLIRNSCDHGIESPDEREAVGKPRQGVVQLSAGQEGNHIVITIEDDGRGLDVEGIRAKAIERGVATEESLQRSTEREIFKYVFDAGFSTAKTITNVSGRGVGLDVVRSNIEKLNGVIELDSDPGRGTRISIKLPLTLAIVQGLVVSLGEEVYIVPLASVLETVALKSGDLQNMNQKRVIRLRDQVLPVCDMSNVLHGGRSRFETDASRRFVVVVGLADRRLGLAVDDLLGQEEVVIKSLGRYLGSTQGIAGATILGDGRVRLILDVQGVFDLVASAN